MPNMKDHQHISCLHLEQKMVSKIVSNMAKRANLKMSVTRKTNIT